MNKNILMVKKSAFVRAGGRKIRYNIFVSVQHKDRLFGIGKGKAYGFSDALDQAFRNAKKNLIKINLINGTFLKHICVSFGATKLRLLPSDRNIGIVAGGMACLILRLYGLVNGICLIIGSKNKTNVIYALFKALKKNNNYNNE